MGLNLIRGVAESEDLELVGAIEAPGHPNLGADAGTLAGIGEIGLTLQSARKAILDQADVVIDFSNARATEALCVDCVAHRCGMVIGTTGHSESELEIIRNTANLVPVLLSPNMSIGVNIAFKLVDIATKALGDDTDIEISEIHHSKKADAPSGTAVRFGEIVAEARAQVLSDMAEYGRHGMTGARVPGKVGFHSARGGDVVGEHTVLFASQGERIEITHRAQSRTNFAMGALRATRFIATKLDAGERGLYSMDQLLDLH